MHVVLISVLLSMLTIYGTESCNNFDSLKIGNLTLHLHSQLDQVQDFMNSNLSTIGMRKQLWA